jgi:hypothetical protein
VVAAVEMKTKEDLKDPSPGMPFPTAQKLVKRALDDSADQLRPPLPGMLAIGARPRAALDVDYVANPSYAGTLEYVEPLG